MLKNESDLNRLDRMERRLRTLEDAEAIRNLKARYAALCDDRYDADAIAALFTERLSGLSSDLSKRDSQYLGACGRSAPRLT